MKKDGKRMSMQGGAGAAEWAMKVYGPAEGQMANPVMGNEIMVHKPMMGGRRHRARKSNRGGSMFVDLAVPAVLLGVQQSAKPNASKKSRGGKRKNARKTQRKEKR
jgi:hypothetical protein